ncbi:hypothetical protein [Streptomyces sp. NPDC059708]|uniref:hypothetical protein n=1 Tax=Streptomyces sp. NPDC059708 TaxID=3346916 RepID=UPI0036B66364
MESKRETDPAHQVPNDVDEKTVRALGALSKALETTERARGHLYGFHQLTGWAADGTTSWRSHLKPIRRTRHHPDHTATPPRE